MYCLIAVALSFVEHCVIPKSCGCQASDLLSCPQGSNFKDDGLHVDIARFLAGPDNVFCSF